MMIFPFPYWKESYFYSYIYLGDPFLKASRPPGWETLWSDIHLHQ